MAKRAGRRCCICTSSEFDRRKKAGEVPENPVCIGLKSDGNVVAYDGILHIINDKSVLDRGQAVWTDQTTKAKNFNIEPYTFVGDPEALFLLKNDGRVGKMQIWTKTEIDINAVKESNIKPPEITSAEQVRNPVGSDAIEDPITFSYDETVFTLKYSIGQLSQLKVGEWLGLIVFLSHENGRHLDETIIKRDHELFNKTSWSIHIRPPSPPTMIDNITEEISGDLSGYYISIYDTEAKYIRQRSVITMPFEISMQALDWKWLGRKMKVSAALVVFKTEKKDYVFQRFLSEIAVKQINLKD